MAAEIFGVSHVPTWLAEIEISSMWSLVTTLAELIKMVQYVQFFLGLQIFKLLMDHSCQLVVSVQ